MWCAPLLFGCSLPLVLVGTLVCWLWYCKTYWLRHRVPHIPARLLWGNLGGILCMRSSPAECVRGLYNHSAAVGKAFVGIHLFYKPAILVRDPELVKRVLIRDFSKFSNRYSNADSKIDPLGSLNIFFLKNPDWKEVRLKLTPFFTSGKMKQMFHLIEEVGRNLDDYLCHCPLDSEPEQCFMKEMKELCAMYTTDVIATVAYGIQANTFTQPNGDFRRNGREVFQFSLRRAMDFTMIFFLPHLVPYFGLKVLPTASTAFLRSTINYVMAERERSGHTRNDLIDILIEFKNSSKSALGGLRYEGDILVAQAALFFTAGFESSSATMSFALYELAKRQDLQQRLRSDISQALAEHDGHVTSQLIDSLDYLHMIVQEVLRLYPPLPFLDRECTVDDEECQSYSLQPYAGYAMPHGMPIYIPVYALHMDPKYFPNPEEFDPERFSATNRKHLVPYTYLPFGLGPHGCIGERFGLLQTKIGLVHFLRNHYVSACEKTRVRMKFDPKALIVQAEGGIYLNVVRDPLGN